MEKSDRHNTTVVSQAQRTVWRNVTARTRELLLRGTIVCRLVASAEAERVEANKLQESKHLGKFLEACSRTLALGMLHKRLNIRSK